MKLQWLILDEADRSVMSFVVQNTNFVQTLELYPPQICDAESNTLTETTSLNICCIKILKILNVYVYRLLDLGFEQDLSFILSTIKENASRKVQKVLLSATLSQGSGPSKLKL